MGARSLPAVSAKVIADIESFVADFKRAENVAKRTTSVIDKELTDLATKTAKKFQLADVGKDILKGAGLFGGFQIAETAASALTDHFRAAAEHAKEIEESTRKTMESTMRMIDLRRTDDQRLAALQKDFERKGRELDAAKNIDRTSSRMNGAYQVQTFTRGYTDDEEKKIAALTAEYQQLGEALDKAKFTREQTESAADLALAISHVGEAGDYTSRKAAALADSLRSANERWEEEQKLIAENLTPLEAYAKQIEKIDRLKRNGLNDDTVWRASVKAMGEMADKINKNGGNRSVADIRKDDDGLSMTLDETQHLTSAARDLGFAFSSAFEDAVIGGEKLGDVVRGLTQDLLRMALRMSVTNPLMNAVFGLTGDAALPTFGGARASGGPVRGGSAYLVGEEGPELFVPGSSGGIVPNGAMGGGGDTFVFSPQIASGVSRQDLAGIMPRMFDMFAAKIADKARRGGGYRRAFA